MFKGKFLEGPELFSKNGTPQKLIIFLHGLGSDGSDLIELAHFMQDSLLDAHFVSPNAVENYDMASFGFQWFSLQNRDPELMYELLENVRPKIEDYIESKVRELNISYDKVALVGFSQGTMTALHTALRMKDKIGCVVGFSGALLAPEKLKNDLINNIPICLIHGVEDDVVDIEMLYKAQDALEQNNIAVETHTMPNLNHSIDNRGLQFAIEFLIKHLNK